MDDGWPLCDLRQGRTPVGALRAVVIFGGAEFYKCCGCSTAESTFHAVRGHQPVSAAGRLRGHEPGQLADFVWKTELVVGAWAGRGDAVYQQCGTAQQNVSHQSGYANPSSWGLRLSRRYPYGVLYWPGRGAAVHQ